MVRPSKPIIEYRINLNLFVNGPSPAVATYGLRRTAVDGEEAKKFICRNFYVDDSLTSLSSTQAAKDLVKSAQAILATANPRLHKGVSNSVEVMEAFPTEERAKDVSDLDLRHEILPAQRSLGVFWDLETDAFTFKVFFSGEAFYKERSIVRRQLCIRPAWFCSACDARREKDTAAACTYGRTDKGEQYPPNLGRPPSYRNDESVDALERLSRRVAEPFRASLLPP